MRAALAFAICAFAATVAAAPAPEFKLRSAVFYKLRERRRRRITVIMILGDTRCQRTNISFNGEDILDSERDPFGPYPEPSAPVQVPRTS